MSKNEAVVPCRGSPLPRGKSHGQGGTERLGILPVHTFFLETKSLKTAFAAAVESLGGPRGALPCLERGDSVVHHSWWTQLLFLSGGACRWEPASPCQGFSLRWT